MGARTRRRNVAGGLGAIVAAMVVGGCMLVVQGQRVQHDLEDAEQHVDAALAALEDGDAGEATAQLAAARVPLADAAGRQEGMVWRVAGRVPLVSPTVRTVGTVTEAAVAGVDVTSVLVRGAAALQAADPVRGALPLAPLEVLDRELDGGVVERLAAAADALAGPVPAPVPGAVLAAHDEVATAVDELLAVATTVRDAAAVVPALLGADGERHYLVAMQNSAELRGTGGLIGFHAVLTVDDGHLSLSPPRPDEALPVPERPAVLPADRAAWLGHTGATASLQTVNLDPDLARTGRTLVDLYGAATGTVLDGVIAVDPIGLAALLGPDEHLEVADAVADPGAGLPSRIPAADLPRTMMVDAYEVLGGDTAARKAFHAALAGAAFDTLLDLSWDPALLDRLAFAVDGRHLQVHSTDPTVQAALERLGIAGRLAAAPGHDLLAVTANNAGGGKPDVHVRHAVRADVLVAPQADAGGGDAVVSARRDATLEVALDNPLAPGSHDDYIVRTSLPGQGRVASLAGTNRTWFTFWAPEDTQVRGGRGDGGALHASVGVVDEARRVDHLLVTPPRSRAAASVQLTGPVSLEASPDGLVYRLTVWRQAKGIADDLEVRIGAGAGWDVVDGAVTGRSDAGRLGFEQPDAPLRMVVDDGVAEVTGTAVGDVTVEVTLVPAGRG